MQKDAITSSVLDTLETTANITFGSSALAEFSSNEHLSNAQIAAAVACSDSERRSGWRHPSLDSAGFHEHPDCIRIAMQWFDAQPRKDRRMSESLPMKHMIEQWAGRYVSQHDVEVAARLLGLNGRYPRFAISDRLIYPDICRLDGIDEAFTQPRYSHRLIGIGNGLLGVGTNRNGVYQKAESGASLHEAYRATLRRASLSDEAVLCMSRRVSP
jgi:hypothetical protein